jgi:hypothetical protein
MTKLVPVTVLHRFKICVGPEGSNRTNRSKTGMYTHHGKETTLEYRLLRVFPTLLLLCPTNQLICECSLEKPIADGSASRIMLH